jgi:hypothetical protein
MRRRRKRLVSSSRIEKYFKMKIGSFYLPYRLRSLNMCEDTIQVRSESCFYQSKDATKNYTRVV